MMGLNGRLGEGWQNPHQQQLAEVMLMQMLAEQQAQAVSQGDFRTRLEAAVIRANALADQCGQLQHERDAALKRVGELDAELARLRRKRS